MISIIVPTYNEAQALPILVQRLAQALEGRPWELIVVDDGSPDGTADLAEVLGRELPIRVVRRAGKLGLASAVLTGFAASTADILVVMDADLSHPPELVPRLVDEIIGGIDLAVGSRYVAGGRIEDWPLIRRIVSRIACLVGSWVVPVRDATSGFFAVNRAVIEGAPLEGVGFKIGFEIFAKGRYTTVCELPYRFVDREHGSSKFGRHEMIAYARQVARAARTSASKVRRRTRSN